MAAVVVAALVSLGSSPSASAAPTGFTVTVPGTANIFGAGMATPPQPGGGGGGTLPVLINLPSGTARVHTLAGPIGLIDCCSGIPGAPPTGGTSPSNINPYGGLSGFIDNHSTPLVGAFLADAAPSGAGPPTIDWSTQHDALDISPAIAELFYLGDGLTTGGTTQTFHVPDGATRLYLGTADAPGFRGDTGFYADNTGQWQVQGLISSTALPVVNTSSATGVESTSATLNGTVDPAGLSVTDRHFNYGVVTPQSVPCAEVVGAGRGPVTVSAVVSGLTPGATYTFQLVASNANGAQAGGLQAFTTHLGIYHRHNHHHAEQPRRDAERAAAARRARARVPGR